MEPKFDSRRVKNDKVNWSRKPKVQSGNKPNFPRNESNLPQHPFSSKENTAQKKSPEIQQDESAQRPFVDKKETSGNLRGAGHASQN